KAPFVRQTTLTTLVQCLLAFGQVLLDRHGGGSSVTDGGGDLPGELLAKIAGRIQPGNGGPHVGIGDQVTPGVVVDVIANDPGVGLEADENEDAADGKLGFLSGDRITQLEGLNPALV